jgi:peroxiredoxin
MNPPPALHAAQSSPRLGLAIASLVLGILAFLSSFLVIGALFGLIGLILGVGHVLRRQGRNAMAWTGVVLSVLSIVIGTGFGVIYFKAINSPEFKKAFEAAMSGAGQGGNVFEKWKGVAAPDFTVTTLDGKAIKLGELKGKRVVVDFWATWCPPCVMEIPHFIQLRSDSPADELVIVGISSEDATTLKSFVKKKGINYPIASEDDLPAPYNEVSSIPTTFMIDRKGVIQEVLVGYHDFEKLKAHALAADFEGEPKPALTVDGDATDGTKP